VRPIANETVIRAAEGIVGGVVGTMAMQQAMQLGPRLPEPLQPPAMRGEPGDFMVSQAEALAGRALPARQHATAASALHWAYGTTWGALLGAAVGRRGLTSWRETLAAGAALGAAVWAAGYVGWLPAAGLSAPVHRQGATHVASALATHVGYGLVVAATMAALERARAARGAATG
jgi:hypothetical protein